MRHPWDAFISYARATSTEAAVALQQGIETFAKPWHQLRSCRVFRDDASMSANAGLWPTIETALTEARYLTLLLTPEAAASEWVNKEVEWWRTHKTAETILLVRHGGLLAWDTSRNDFSAESNCVPLALRGAYQDEPRWVDFGWFNESSSDGKVDRRFDEAVADLAAPIRGIERSELIGENVKQLRKAKRLASGAVATLIILLAAAVVTASVAVGQRNQLAKQTVTLTARQLANVANRYTSSDVQRSQLFAVAGLRTEDSSEVRSALLSSLTSSPALQGFQTLPSEVRALEVSRSGNSLVAGLDNGAVYRSESSWSAVPELLLDLGRQVSAVGISADGATGAAMAGDAISGTVAKYWHQGVVGDLPAYAEVQDQGAVAVSPDGRIIATNAPYTDDRGLGGPTEINLFDVATGKSRRHSDPHAEPIGDVFTFSRQVAFLDNERLLLVSHFQDWAVIRISDGTVLNRGGTTWISDNFDEGVTEFTTNGSWVFHTSASEGDAVEVWNTVRATGPLGLSNDPPLTVDIRYASIEDLAITTDGRWAAVSDATGLHVRQTGAPRTSTAPSVQLTGVPVASHVAFLDGPTRLVSASGSSLAFWDTESPGRAAEEVPINAQAPLVMYSGDYNRVRMALSPDGNSYALLNMVSGAIQRGSLPGRAGVPPETATLTDMSPDPSLFWSDDQTVVLLSRSQIKNAPAWARTLTLPEANVMGISADRKTAVAVGAAAKQAVAYRYEIPSGRLLGQVSLDLPPEWEPGPQPMGIEATVSTDGTVVGLFVNRYLLEEGVPRTLVFLDAETGSVLHEEPVGGGREDLRIAIDGHDAVIQFGHDHAELWTDFGRGGRESFGSDLLPYPPTAAQDNFPVFSSSGHIALTTKTGTALYSREGLSEAASLPAPAARAGHPRITSFSDDGTRLFLAYLGPTKATAQLTAVALDAGTQRERACGTAGRRLTQTEWARLVGAGIEADLVCE